MYLVSYRYDDFNADHLEFTEHALPQLSLSGPCYSVLIYTGTPDSPVLKTNTH